MFARGGGAFQTKSGGKIDGVNNLSFFQVNRENLVVFLSRHEAPKFFSRSQKWHKSSTNSLKKTVERLVEILENVSQKSIDFLTNFSKKYLYPSTPPHASHRKPQPSPTVSNQRFKTDFYFPPSNGNVLKQNWPLDYLWPAPSMPIHFRKIKKIEKSHHFCCSLSRFFLEALVPFSSLVSFCILWSPKNL